MTCMCHGQGTRYDFLSGHSLYGYLYTIMYLSLIKVCLNIDLFKWKSN